jgi:hypothetical protein
LQKIKASTLAHFVGESSMSKLSLVFVEKKTWESWISVFDAWKQGELIGEDGKDPTIIPRLPQAHITKMNVAPTLGLRDSNLVS